MLLHCRCVLRLSRWYAHTIARYILLTQVQVVLILIISEGLLILERRPRTFRALNAFNCGQLAQIDDLPRLSVVLVYAVFC